MRRSRGQKAHCTLLRDILPVVGTHPSRVSKRLTSYTPHEPSSKAFPTQKAAIKRAKRDDTFVQISTDGPHSAAGVEAAAVMEGGHWARLAGVRLGEASHYSVLDAEIAAIRLAIHLARGERLLDKAVIFSDSQEAIRLVDPSQGVLANPSPCPRG